MAFSVSYMDLPAQYALIREEILEAVDEVCSRGAFILRDEVTAFEAAVADRLSVDHVVGLNSGADALYHSLRALGLRAGDEVITVAHTFVATLSAIVHCGAVPVLVDIGDDGLMDVDQICPRITARTRAILPVHLNGEVCRMDRVMALARERGLWVVEDAAQAFGSRYDGRAAGAFGDAGCFSLHPMKTFAVYGDGGFVSTNSESLARDLRIDRDHGQSRERTVLRYGYSSRLDNLQAAIGIVKLRHFDEWIARRRQLARQYHAAFDKLPGLRLPPAPREDPRFFNTFSSYVIRTKAPRAFQAHLAAAGIETFSFWTPPLHRCPGLDLEAYSLPKTETVAQEVLSLTIHPALSDEAQRKVIDAIQDFCRQGATE